MAEYVVSVSLPGTEEHFTRLATGKLTIGRSEDSDICLRYPTVSRPHAEIDSPEPGRFTVRDLTSRNGTLVNGQLLRDEEVNLDGRVTLQIGPYVLLLASPDEQEDTLTVASGESAPRLRLDRGLRALSLGGKTVIEHLSPLEYRLIELLDGGAPNVVSSTGIGDSLWGEGQWDVYMLHNLVRRVRRKLEDAGLDAETHLVGIAGVGYRLA